MMEHSTSYTSFVNLINNTNSFARVNGIPGNLLVEIYDWERDDVENIIWNRFIKMNDMDMTYYLPRLKREVSMIKNLAIILTPNGLIKRMGGKNPTIELIPI